VLLEKPYYLEPSGQGSDKVYALLRESMREAGVIGIARVVMHTKEHLAALIPSGPALILNTIRWASEIGPMTDLKLPPDGKAAANLKAGDLKMAAQLVNNMTGKWKPADYTENFSAAVHELVKRKIKAGETESVTPVEDASTEERSSNVLDLTELLAKSLRRKAAPAPKKAPAKSPGRQSGPWTAATRVDSSRLPGVNCPPRSSGRCPFSHNALIADLTLDVKLPNRGWMIQAAGPNGSRA